MATPKHVRRGGRLSLILGAILASLLFASVAIGDLVVSNVGISVPSRATMVSGGNLNVNYWVEQGGQGGMPGCDATSLSPAVVTINVPANVTADPSPLSFSNCGTSTTNTQTVGFTSSKLGRHQIPVVSVTDSVGVYNVQNSDFTLDVNPRPPSSVSFTRTEPTSLTFVWAQSPDQNQLTSYRVNRVGHTFFDTLDPTHTQMAVGGLEPGTTYCWEIRAVYTQTIGTTAVDFVSTPLTACGLTDPADSTPPLITPNITGTLGNNGWYVDDVSVTWGVSDAESTITSTSGCGPTLIQADTGGMALTCSATSAGGTSSKSVTIKRDATNPSVTVALARAADHNGWYNSSVGYGVSASSDATSGIASCQADAVYSGPDDASASVSRSCTDKAGNVGSDSVSFQYDATAPTINGVASPAANSNGWNNTSVLVDYTCNDGTSGIASCGPDEPLANEGVNQSSSGTAVDNAGNSASDSVTGINIDKTDPNVSLNGGPANGATYYFGFVPDAPTCDANDALSGLDGACSVSGYWNVVGTHTVSASASDKAGNSASVSRTYTVLAWTLRGFYAPVDMGTSVVNTVKNGSTVPLKFEIFAGSNELTDPTYVKSLTQQLVNCTSFSGDAVDEIETTATGGTSLRYDTTAGQFIYNWKTPAQMGKCYVVKMTTDDGSSVSAQFKLK